MAKVFISYCSKPSKYKNVAHLLADRLIKAGIDVVIDKYNLKLGDDISDFMDMIGSEKINKILILCTKEYKTRADNKRGGVGIEAVLLERIANKGIIIPIIIEEHSNQVELLPLFLPRTVCFCDFSSDVEFESSEFADLCNNIKGIYPEKPAISHVESVVNYFMGGFPGLPDEIIASIKHEAAQWLLSEVKQTIQFMMSIGFWMNLNEEQRAVTRVAAHVPNIVSQLNDNNLGVQLLSSFAYFSDLNGNNEFALDLISKAIAIAEKNIKDQTSIARLLTLRYQKAVALHKLDRLPEALDIYLTISTEESQNYLSFHVVYESTIYAGHVYSLLGNIDEARILYSRIIKNCMRVLKENPPLAIQSELKKLRYRAICALKNLENDSKNQETAVKIESDAHSSHRYEADSEWIYKIGFQYCLRPYPINLAMPIRLLQD